MRPLLIMAALAGAAVMLSGCRDKKPEPVPGPQAALTDRTATDAGRQANTVTPNCSAQGHRVGAIRN